MRRFDKMHGALAAYGVTMFALSKESVADAARQRKRDRLEHVTLLSDPELAVIKQYGLEHHKAIEFSTGRFAILGIPLALAPSVKTMAIPTTLIIDEEGVIQWVDQADDYRLRSSEERVLAAVKAAFA